MNHGTGLFRALLLWLMAFPSHLAVGAAVL